MAGIAHRADLPADRRQSLRHQSTARGARRQSYRTVILSIRRRKPLIPYDTTAYRQRNLIERMFGRLKDYRRIATRYDKLARSFLAGTLLAAIAIWWLN
jgi:transposase